MLLKIVIENERHLCFIKTSRRATYIKLLWLELSATLQKSRSETKKALNGPSFFYCEQIKRLVKLPKYHFFQFAKQRKQSCPLIIVIKCTFCIRNRANLQWGQNVSESHGYKIFLWMQLQKYFDSNVLCGSTLSFFQSFTQVSPN